MPERPVNNLPPGSQPWAREIAGAIDATQFEAKKANMNNKNAFKTINATLEQLAEQQRQLANQQAELLEQQEYLAGLKTVVDEVPGFSGTIVTPDSTGWALVGTNASVTVNVTTGRVLLIAQARFLAGANSVTGYLYPGLVTWVDSEYPTTYSSSYFFAESSPTSDYLQETTNSVTHVDVVNVSPGVHTFTAARGAWCDRLEGNERLSGGTLRLIVQVIENN